MPPEDTKSTRAGALAIRRSRRRRVSRCGPSTFVANVSSTPSSVSRRSLGSTPALCTSTCTGSSLASRRSAQARTERRNEMSTSSQRTSVLPVSSTIWRRAVSPRPASRTSSRSEAPSRAIPRLAASPSPPLAPVTRHTRPSSRGGSVQCSMRPRNSGPMREKPPITLASSVASTSPASLPGMSCGHHTRAPHKAARPGVALAGRESGWLPWTLARFLGHHPRARC